MVPLFPQFFWCSNDIFVSVIGIALSVYENLGVFHHPQRNSEEGPSHCVATPGNSFHFDLK